MLWHNSLGLACVVTGAHQSAELLKKSKTGDSVVLQLRKHKIKSFRMEEVAQQFVQLPTQVTELSSANSPLVATIRNIFMQLQRAMPQEIQAVPLPDFVKVMCGCDATLVASTIMNNRSVQVTDGPHGA